MSTDEVHDDDDDLKEKQSTRSHGVLMLTRPLEDIVFWNSQNELLEWSPML